MKKLTYSFALASFVVMSVGEIRAQNLPFGALVPGNPTSADNLKLSVLLPGCIRYNADSYRVSMSNNNVTVLLGEGELLICTPTLARSRSEFDLGRLPAGSYTITLIEAAINGVPASTLIDKAPIAIADARATKIAPYVRLDYSGAWWDPNDSGWGLFIWQDARGPRDSLLAAWFTYTPDGKPVWYTFQPVWTSNLVTGEAALLQTTRPPGATSPPLGPGNSISVGTASLDFTNYGIADEGKLTYTFNNGTKLVRTIQRLKP